MRMCTFTASHFTQVLELGARRGACGGRREPSGSSKSIQASRNENVIILDGVFIVA